MGWGPEPVRRDETMDQLRHPLHRPGESELWSICEEPGCNTRVRFEYRCREHREAGISTVKFCQAPDCWDTLHRNNPRQYCGLHEHLSGPAHEIWWEEEAVA